MKLLNLCPKLHVSGAKFVMNPVESILSILAHSRVLDIRHPAHGVTESVSA